MKLKELPKSIKKSISLSLLSLEELEDQDKKRIPVIVSLTTIPSRVKTLHITIRSLLNQDTLPEKIVLWLNDSYKNKVPRKLQKLTGNTFEIRFSEYTFSHRKLIHSLQAFKNKAIITVDDDLIYHREFLKLLYIEHLKNPNVVIGNRCREISYNEEGNILPYLKWPFLNGENKTYNKKLLMPVGAFGVIYPANVLNDNVHNIDLFNRLSPKSDDLWFKTMTLLNNNLSIQAENKAPDPTPIIATQGISLKKINNKLDYKRVQWEQITKHFNLSF